MKLNSGRKATRRRQNDVDSLRGLLESFMFADRHVVWKSNYWNSALSRAHCQIIVKNDTSKLWNFETDLYTLLDRSNGKIFLTGNFALSFLRRLQAASTGRNRSQIHRYVGFSRRAACGRHGTAASRFGLLRARLAVRIDIVTRSKISAFRRLIIISGKAVHEMIIALI